MAPPQQQPDLRAELGSGDPVAQAAALFRILRAAAAGADVAPHVTAACQLLLGNSTAAPAVRRLAYDVAAAAPTLSDAGAAAAVEGRWLRLRLLRSGCCA